VDSRGAFTHALDSFAPEVILSDSGVAGFHALDALHLLQSNLPSSPLLLVSGALEQTGTACLKAGAADYVPKTELARLGNAIRLALEVRAPLRRLSGRQSAVFQRLASGQSTKQIASQLRISVKTIRPTVVDGLQVLSELRGHPRTSALPVVLLTSANLERDVAESYRLGANSFVQKPLEFTKFRDLSDALASTGSRSTSRRRRSKQIPPSVEALPERIVQESLVPPVGGPETILLVDDEAAVRVAARRILDQFGYHVIEAPGAEEALPLAVKHPEPVHLLLTDIVMSRMNGRELAKVFTRLHPEARVVLRLGYADDEVLRRDVSRAESCTCRNRSRSARWAARCARRSTPHGAPPGRTREGPTGQTIARTTPPSTRSAAPVVADAGPLHT
jgi:DNA-binding NarL/FixJ family response regulator